MVRISSAALYRLRFVGPLEYESEKRFCVNFFSKIQKRTDIRFVESGVVLNDRHAEVGIEGIQAKYWKRDLKVSFRKVFTNRRQSRA